MILPMAVAVIVSCLYLRAVSKQRKARDEEDRLRFEYLMSGGAR